MLRLPVWFLFALPLAAQPAPLTVGNVLAKSCLSCHGKASMSDLDLRTPAGLMKGGKRGAAVVPGNAEQSRLYRFIAGLDKPHMPPNGTLPKEEIAAVKAWIDAGAKELVIEKAAEQKYWAFIPPESKVAGGKNVVDAFLKTGAAADRRTLIRRAYLDLTGLPPTPDAVEAFVKDPSPDAWPKLIDRLLATPQYGERWARHWLDLVRYADSGGYEYDRDRPHAWRYRDYVVKAFNEDKPYDRFILEQVAGDELWPDSHEALVATGYLRHGLEANIKTEETRQDELDDLVSTTSGAMLGLTVGCARCHDHKFDPIPQKDYKAMQAIFWNTKYREAPLAPPEVVAANKAENAQLDQLVDPLKKERLAIMKRYREALALAKREKLPAYIKEVLAIPEEKRTPGQKLTATQLERTQNFDENDVLATVQPADKERLSAIDAEIKRLDAKRPTLPLAMTIENTGPKSEHKPGLLSAVSWNEPDFSGSEKPRTVLAKWIASRENPLTARVMVNRVFLNHFGYGLVDTPANFGKSGSGVKEQPLLDALAVEFVKSGWSIKSLHRQMMLSQAYVGQTRPRRLEAEAIRDSMLAAAGTLDLKMGGPSVQPYIDPSLYQGSSGRTWHGTSDDDPATWRRSLYVFTKRSIPVPMLDVFDKPDGIGACARRNRSTTSIQSLIMMNSGFTALHTRKFAERLQREAGTEPAKQVERAYAIALGRAPTAQERSAAVDFIQSSPKGLVDFCYTVFNLNEFAYIP